MKEIDLSADIVNLLPRRPGEQVTCRRITTNFYRCNWWALQSTAGYDNPLMPGELVTTSRICRSQFLRVVVENNQLCITVMSSSGGEDTGRSA